MKKIEIIGDWEESLLWCPSQLTLKLKYGEQHFLIYLRWRHTDPWTADLITTNKFYETDDGGWYKLDIPFYKDEDYAELKLAVIPIAKSFIYSGQISLL